MFKKIIAFLIASTMLFSLVACDSSSSTSDDASGSTGYTDNEDAGALTVWCWDPAFNLYSMEEAAAVYQETYPDFEIDIVEVAWDDLQTALITAATSGDYSTLPDIFLCQNNALQKNIINYPDLFTDLTDSGIDFSEFGDGVLGYSTVDGSNYAVPFDNGAAVMALRTDVIAEAGYTLDDFNDITWDEFIEMGIAVKNETGMPLLSGQAGSGDIIIMMLKTAGISLFDENGDPYISENEALYEAYEVYQALTDNGILVEYSSWDEYVAGFVNGSTAGVMNGCWILGSVQLAEDQSGDWGVANIPTLDGISGSVNYSENGGSSWVIASSSDQQVQAIEFLDATFAGSVEFYEEILEQAGALSNWSPAGESDLYAAEQEFFGGQAVYSDIVDYASNVLPFGTGVYYYEAADAIAVGATNIVNGADIQTEMDSVQSTVEFYME